MGIMERALKKRNRKGRIQRIVLKTVATAGMLSIALCAPMLLTFTNLLNTFYALTEP